MPEEFYKIKRVDNKGRQEKSPRLSVSSLAERLLKFSRGRGQDDHATAGETPALHPKIDLANNLGHYKAMEVKIREAKANFSKLLQRVAIGEEITITRAGVPVARLVPVQPVNAEA